MYIHAPTHNKTPIHTHIHHHLPTPTLTSIYTHTHKVCPSPMNSAIIESIQTFNLDGHSLKVDNEVHYNVLCIIEFTL